MARGDLRIPGPQQQAPEDHLSEAFAAFGLVPVEPLELEEEFFLWPENVTAFNLWLSLQTQWVTDNGERTGLNYPGVEVCIRNWEAVRKNERRWHFAAMQSMERAALDAWAQLKQR